MQITLVVKNNNMSSPFQKKFTEKKINATTPLLNSYERGGVGDIYVSSIDSIQKAVGSVQDAMKSYMNEDSQHKADRLADRVSKRKDRFSHKDEEDKNTAYSNKTNDIASRAADAQIEANKKATKKQTMLEKELEIFKNKNK